MTSACNQQTPTSTTANKDQAENKNEAGTNQQAAPFPSHISLEDADKRVDEAVVIIKSGHAQQGFDQLNEIIKLCPACAKAWDLRANLLAQSSQPVSAIRDLTQLLKLKPDHQEAWNMRGFILLTLNRYQEATKDFDQALKLNPQFAKAYNNRGLAKIALKDFSNALHDFNLAIQHKTDYTDAYNNRGYALLEIGNYAKAIDNFTNAIKLDPNYANAYNNRGLVRIKTGEIEEAIQDFTQAITLAPYAEKHYIHRRDAHKTLGHEVALQADEQMIAWIRELNYINDKLQKNPGQAELIVDRARHFTKIKDFTKAQADLETVLKARPEHTPAQLEIASISFKTQNYDQAISQCDQIIAREHNHTAYSIRGDAALAKGNFDQAVRDYESAQRFDPQVAKAFQLRANWHKSQGRTDQAQADLESAKLLDPNLNSTALK